MESNGRTVEGFKRYLKLLCALSNTVQTTIAMLYMFPVLRDATQQRTSNNALNVWGGAYAITTRPLTILSGITVLTAGMEISLCQKEPIDRNLWILIYGLLNLSCIYNLFFVIPKITSRLTGYLNELNTKGTVEEKSGVYIKILIQKWRDSFIFRNSLNLISLSLTIYSIHHSRRNRKIKPKTI